MNIISRLFLKLYEKCFVNNNWIAISSHLQVRIERFYQEKNRNVDDGRACSWENEWLMKYCLEQ